MTSRRDFLVSGTAALMSVPLLHACSSGLDDDYARGAQETWRPLRAGLRGPMQVQRELVRLATLAPSSHNTQCWKFTLGDAHIGILPDTTRRCPAVDPDDHHLFVSLGCALENLEQAAHASGLQTDVSFDDVTAGIGVQLTPAAPLRSALSNAITARQCTRAEYDGRPVATSDLALLERAGRGDGVRVLLFTAHQQMEGILDYVARGNSAQMADDAFVRELKTWIRFNAGEAVAKGDGLFTAATGNPTMPRWLGSRAMSVFFTANGENDKYARQVRSSSGIAVFASDASDRWHWVEAGRCYQRFALQATALGIRNAMLNQPVEVATIRPQFTSHLGLSAGRPDLVVRFGYGGEMLRSLRRPVGEVLVPAQAVARTG